MERPGSGSPLKGVRVLVVEDEYFLADDLSSALAGYGANVLGPVGDVASAMAVLQHEGCDCAILDIDLRGRQAFDVALAAQSKGIPTAFVTGYDESVLPASLADVERFEKPVDLARVIGFVSRTSQSRR